MVLSCVIAHLGLAKTEEIKGLPFIRTFPLDEIGNIPRGLRLSFDTFGRFAVMYDGVYAVLNDSTWVNRIDEASPDRVRMTTIRVRDGAYYYGGRGSWGAVELAADGRFRARSLVPTNAPAWTGVTPFNEVLPTQTGVYFYELGGVVYWDFSRHRNAFFELPRVSSVFCVGTKVFVSCQDKVLREIIPSSESVAVVSGSGLEGAIVEHTALLDESHALLALNDGRLVCFDGKSAVPWTPQASLGLIGRVSAITSLADGGVALAFPDKGLYVVSADGSLLWTLPYPEFSRVGALAANEPGVLWVAGENAVHKIFYDTPLTSFGQQLGLTAAWPKVAPWGDRIVVCSNWNIYEWLPSTSSGPSHFQVLSGTENSGAVCLASSGSQLVAGSATGVFSVSANSKLSPIIRMEHLGNIEFIAPDICIAIGSREIAALRYSEGVWRECAPRIAGVGDSPIRTLVHGDGVVWVEMGGDLISRIVYRKGLLSLQKIQLPWSGAQWTNVGTIGSLIVLSGSPGQRTYYDDEHETFCAAPSIERLLNRSPRWITRVTRDSSGTLWATHDQGVVTFKPIGDDFIIDAATFELRNDFYPAVSILSENNVWITSGRSLYHVEPSNHRPLPPRTAVLVSLVTDHLNLELQKEESAAHLRPQFAFDDNSLSVRLFSGTYAWRYPPLYEYRLTSYEPWNPVDPGLLLRFPKLRDGRYRLEVRPKESERTDAQTLTLDFVIKPPAYRAPLAYFGYVTALLILVGGGVRWSTFHSKKHNEALERLVQERTRQLHLTTEKLSEETRNAATMAERNRLAGEIHDSLQQSLSGSILQLDATMTMAAIPPEVRSRLDIVRSMLSYTREEIQHSVWDLESPLLQNSNLGDALRKVANFINPGTIKMNIVAPSQATTLEPAVQHNLLRIAQEAVTNAVKHANASRIDLRLHFLPFAVQLIIADDGSGFDPDRRSKIEGHFGLRGIRSRARSIKAELSVKSSPQSGTVIQVNVPIKKSQNDANS